MKVSLDFNPYNHEFVIKYPPNLEDSLLMATLQTNYDFKNVGSNQIILNVRMLSGSELFNIVRDIIDFFVNEKINYTFNGETSKLIKNAYDDLTQREKIKTEATKLLKAKYKHNSELLTLEYRRTLKKYQEDPVRSMIKIPYFANFSVPGSGKTAMLYAAYSRLKAIGAIQKLFIIAPSTAYLAWTEEYEKCFNKKPQIGRITGSKYKRIKFYHAPEKHEIFITTYQTATSDINELINLLSSSRFLLVLDESHNIKRFERGAWSSAVRRLATHATRRIILTGTPVPNSLFDLWSQFYFLDPDIVGTKEQFKILIQARNAEDKLREKVLPFFRRVKKRDLGLPDPVYRTIRVEPYELQKRIYEAIKHATLEELNYPKVDREFLKNLRRAIMIRLMQAASNPTLLFEKSEEFDIPSIQKEKIIKSLEPSIIEGIKNYSKFETPCKLIAAENLVRNLLKRGKRKKVLIWSVWIKNLKILEKRLKDFNPIIIYGDIPINEEKDPIDNRELRIKNFKSDLSCRVLIANPGACGESISLHDVCHDAIYVDRTFNAGQYMQSLDRIHRVGLDPSSKTNYYLLQVAGTIDETINRRLDEKRARMAKVLNEDFEVLNLETNLGEVSGISEDSQKDFEETIKDLKK